MTTYKILHIILQLSRGGAARSMMALAKFSSQLSSLEKHFQHSVISLAVAEPEAIQMAESASMTVINAPDHQSILQEIKTADIVHFHFWNHPYLYEFLQLSWPAMRLVMWFHIAGDRPPQVITRQLVDYADIAIPCNPFSANLPVFNLLSPQTRAQKIRMVYDAADFTRLSNLEPQSHAGFNVGYIGTVDFVKMHPRYVPMSAGINIPKVQFIVCGTGNLLELQRQAKQLSIEEKFQFRGYVEDIKSVLEILDVYGYPLCEDTYAAAELNLQEAMYAGVPPVVFPHGGIRSLVIHGETGLVVNNELEYQQAVEYLYHHPEERQRLGKNAQQYAMQHFGAENAAQCLNPIYATLLQQPKRPRCWGVPVGEKLLNQPLTLDDVTGMAENHGARAFIQSLGDTAPQFSVSLNNGSNYDLNQENIEKLLAADQQISCSSPLLQSLGSGGILSYQSYYPKDGYLRFWSGLILQHKGLHAEAIQQFHMALQLGCDGWRVNWFLANSAEQSNQIILAQQAIESVLQAIPGFGRAQEMSRRLQTVPQPSSQPSKSFETQSSMSSQQLKPSKDILTETKQWVEQYRQQPSPEGLTKLQQLRRQIAEIFLATKAGEPLKSAYIDHLGQAYQLILSSGLKNEVLTEAEQYTVTQWQNDLSQGLNQPDSLQKLLVFSLYTYPHQINSGWYRQAPIPRWFIPDYLQFMLTPPQYFQQVGEVERYAVYLKEYVSYLHSRIINQSYTEDWKSITQIFIKRVSLIPLYFSQIDLRETIIQRNQILEFALRGEGCQLGYDFPVNPPQRQRIRLGILCLHFNPQTETHAILPIFEQLDRSQFEIILYACRSSSHALEQYCQSRVERLVKLPKDLKQQVQLIRADQLDLLVIGTNLTAVVHEVTLLALHRLARVQLTSIASPITSGMSTIDYYLAGDLTAPKLALQSQYSEELINLCGSGICFRYPLPESGLATQPSRQSWGASSDTVIFISGANFYKLIPEIQQVWIKILSAVPNSILVLYPFNPNWTKSYPVKSFVSRIQANFAQSGVAANRLVLLNSLPSRTDVKACLKLADIYLDSYPYGGATSVIDPLEVGLPTVVLEGDQLRFRQAAALLRELQIPELVTDSETMYINAAITLAQEPELRQQVREKIQKNMQQAPFLDPSLYAAKVSVVFQTLLNQKTLNQLSSEPIPVLGRTNLQTPAHRRVFLARLVDDLNLYEVDPSNSERLARLRQQRREMAEFWLQVPPDQLEAFYQHEMGTGYQIFLHRGIQQETLTEIEQQFVDQLTQIAMGLQHHKSLNCLIAAMLYYVPGKMLVRDAEKRLPSWLLKDYKKAFESQSALQDIQQSIQSKSATKSQVTSTVGLSPEQLIPSVSDSQPRIQMIKAQDPTTTPFKNQLLGCINLYDIDPTEPSVLEDLRRMRRQLADFWLSVAPQSLPNLYQDIPGQGQRSLLQSRFLRHRLEDTEQEFLQQLMQEVNQASDASKMMNYFLAAMLYCRPEQLQVPDPNLLPDWLKSDYQKFIEQFIEQS
ncbi:MAG: glycosyltransferase [Microcoleaceae cyanobacterium]